MFRNVVSVTQKVRHGPWVSSLPVTLWSGLTYTNPLSTGRGARRDTQVTPTSFLLWLKCRLWNNATILVEREVQNFKFDTSS